VSDRLGGSQLSQATLNHLIVTVTVGTFRACDNRGRDWKRVRITHCTLVDGLVGQNPKLQ
jgi:hypothetical protein